MAKIQIKKSELDRIIKEETLKFKKAITLKKELKNIEEQLKKLNECGECGVNEVEAGEMHKISSDTGFEGTQAKPKFHNPTKNPHTMMEDETEEIEDLDIDMDNEDAEDGKIDKVAVLSAIEDLKIALNLHGDAEEDVEDIEDIESVEDVEGGSEEIPASEESPSEEEEGEELNSEKEEEGDETFEFEEGEAKENTEENNVKEEVDNTLMESEKRRMSVLAGIIKG